MANPADVSSTDQNSGPISTATSAGSDPNYPRWMYHPTLPNQIVTSAAAQQALIASDSAWSTADTYSTS